MAGKVTLAQVREQCETWLTHERGAEEAIAAEEAAQTAHVDDTIRRLARTRGSIATLETVLKLIDGGYA